MSENDGTQDVVRRIEKFYDLLAPDYDAMTSFEKRFANERPFFKSLMNQFYFRSALDAGCGSGFHAILLSMLGVEVLGVDASSEMLRLAEENARTHGVKLRTLQCSFDTLDQRVAERFASVFVMGNSLAHLLTPVDLEKALRNFANVILPQGVLVIQVLNYDRVIARREHIQSEKQSGSKTFVRSYDYKDEAIEFSIHTREQKVSATEEKVQKIKLRPVFRLELVPLLEKIGFRDISVFGDISLVPFDESESKDLVVLCVKNG